MYSIVVFCLVCLAGCAMFALVDVGVAQLCFKLYTEFHKQRQGDQQRARPALAYEGTPDGDKIRGTIDPIGEALLSVADRDKFIEAFNAPLKFGHPMPAALTVPARAAILAYHRHLLHRLVELGRADQRGR